MLVKYIDSDYIIERLQKPSWGEVEEPDFYITMASNRVKTLIFPAEQGDPNNLSSYTAEQQEAIKLATAIYTLWYFDTNYDFTNGSVSVNFGGVSMSESKTYNGEMVLPNVFDILKQANLIPTTETFIFNGENNLYADTPINPQAFKDLQQELERQANVNIVQDAKLIMLNDTIANMGGFSIPEMQEDIKNIKKEQEEQNTNINQNAQNIENITTEQQTQNNNIATNTTEINTIKAEQIEQNNALNNKANLTANTFTGPQTINSPKALILNNNATLMEITAPGEKNAYIDFIQPKAGFRNYANIYIRVKHGSTANWDNILKIQARNTGTGLFLEAEGNKVSFLNPTTISNIDTPTADGDAVNKSYVDSVKNTTTTNTNEIATIKTDLGHLGDQVIDVHNKVNENKTNIGVNKTQISETKNLLNQTIAGLRNLKPFRYLGSYVPGTTYNINDAVSLGDTLYLSNRDNNTTTPPGSDWVVLETTNNIDLTEYYTRNEIDAQQQAQNERITNNANALNNTVKTSGDQTINGNKTITSPLTINNSVGIKRNGSAITILELTNQGEKFAHIDFIQPSGGFRNYANLKLRIKNGSSSSFTDILKFQIRDTGTGIFLEAEGNKVSFINPTTITNIATPTADGDAVPKRYLDNGFVSKSQNEYISGYKTFNGNVQVVNNFSLGVVNEAPIINGSNYSFSNGKLKKTDNKPFTDSDELITKGYVDSKVGNINFNDVINRITNLERYAKTGILQFQIIDFNQGRVRIKWLQKPLGWNDSNVLLNRLHVSGQRYDVARDDIWTEFSAGGFQEWSNIRLNPTSEFNTNQLNNNIFKDLNLASTIYMWLDWNTQLVESDVPNKIQVPAAFRYEKNGYSWYVPVKMK